MHGHVQLHEGQAAKERAKEVEDVSARGSAGDSGLRLLG